MFCFIRHFLSLIAFRNILGGGVSTALSHIFITMSYNIREQILMNEVIINFFITQLLSFVAFRNFSDFNFHDVRCSYIDQEHILLDHVTLNVKS